MFNPFQTLFCVFCLFRTLFCVFCIYLDRLQAWRSDEDHIWRVPIKQQLIMVIPIVIIITVVIDILLLIITLILIIIIIDYFSPIPTLRSAVSSAPAAPHRGLPFFPETEITVQNIAISEIEVILF